MNANFIQMQCDSPLTGRRNLDAVWSRFPNRWIVPFIWRSLVCLSCSMFYTRQFASASVLARLVQ
jgi:hypothetical protein